MDHFQNMNIKLTQAYEVPAAQQKKKKHADILKFMFIFLSNFFLNISNIISNVTPQIRKKQNEKFHLWFSGMWSAVANTTLNE